MKRLVHFFLASAAMISLPLAEAVGASLTITQQPQDQLVVYTNPVASAIFCVGVTASDSNATITYQWSRDNGGGFTPIPGANESCVTFVPALADNGARFRCDINIPGDSVTSDSATLTVVQPNTAPQFTKGSDVTVSQDSGPSTTPGWVTGITASTPAGIVGEAGQVVQFFVSNDNPSLFSVQPAISPNGTLTFTPAPGACGRANLTIVARDDGGTALGGVDTSAAQTNSIRVTCPNNCPTAIAAVHPALSIECVGLSSVVIAVNNSNACVVLDGSGSSDPDGDALSYSWTVNGQTAQGATVTNWFGIGTHQVCLTVSDGSCADTNCVTVEVISSSQAVATLILTVETSSLSRNRQRPLLISLKAACASFDDGETTAGVQQLAAFQNKVRAQVVSTDATLAQQLIDCSQAIIDGVSGR